MLNEYLPALTAPILQQEGTVDKFIGDAVLAVFGSPEPDAQQYEKAVRAALAMQTAAEGLSEARRRRNQPTCRVGIGIHCGDVVHGFVGSQERMEFTVVGDAVNRTSRYCDAAQGGEVLISPDVFRHVHRVFNTLEKEIVAKHDEKLRAHLVTGIKDRQTVA
jgi:class 3 adenylate cyclase